ncbi:MAG: alpha/beta hydrolase [Chloroflexi bacterium]|nr:alpha/beta hydrolase [Chloroflexota bacterium]
MENESGFAPINGTRLYYEAAGDGDALVLIHGFTLDTRMWDDQFEAFAAEFRVIRYDLRGFGRSDLPAGQVYAHIGDLKALLAYLGVQQAHLLGLSMGGGIAIDFTLMYPEVVISLTCVDSTLGGYVWPQEMVADWRKQSDQARTSGVQAGRDLWLQSSLFHNAVRDPELARRLGEMVSDYSGWYWIPRDTEKGIDPPALARLGQVTVPVLVVVGEHDLPDFHHVAEILNQQVLNARLVVLPGAGHLANMEAPLLFNRHVAGFLAEVGRP